MRFAVLLGLTATPLLTLAGPIKYTRDDSAPSSSSPDLLVFQFANVLEDLETQFYSQALSTFTDADFTDAGFSSAQLTTQLITTIQSDEQTHFQTLNQGIATLGGTPLSCTFNFGDALSSVTSMINTARVVENIGVAAYLGGATLITDTVLLADAASILTVEARHQTILNMMSGTGNAIPQAFDIPLTPGEILAMASPFISGCTLPIPANVVLTITNTGTPVVGTALTFSYPSMPSDTSSLFCQMLIGGSVIAIALPFDQCVVPPGINGPVAIFITSDGQPLLNNVRDRAQISIEAGPSMAFIDSAPDAITSLVRPSSSNGSLASSTSDVSPAAASAIAASGTDSTNSSSILGSTDSTNSTSTLGSTDSLSSNSSGPNLATGDNSDGSINVLGWINLPSPTASSS